MTTIFRKIIDGYNFIEHDLSDPRSREYWIIVNPIIMLSLAIIYYKFVKEWGPNLMKDRKPLNVDRIMAFYNVVQIIACSYVAYRAIYLIWWPGTFNILCEPICFDDTPEQRETLEVTRQYYLLKILDMTDTIFFVLRKKQNQITFLHIYHHLGMILASFMSVKYLPGSYGFFVVTINSIVHVCMYFYYLLTSIDSEYKKSIWWKKHLTQLQMVQFLMIFTVFLIPLLNLNCSYPKWVCSMFAPQNIFMFIMFYDYYVKEYVKKNNNAKINDKTN